MKITESMSSLQVTTLPQPSAMRSSPHLNRSSLETMHASPNRLVTIFQEKIISALKKVWSWIKYLICCRCFRSRPVVTFRATELPTGGTRHEATVDGVETSNGFSLVDNHVTNIDIDWEVTDDIGLIFKKQWSLPW